MAQYLDLNGLKKFKEQADAAYLPIKGTIPLTGSINLTTESVASLGIKYAKVANNSINFYVIADSNGKLPSSETRININSDITSLVGAEGANVGDLFVIGKLSLKPVYKIIPLNDAKAANSEFKGTEGVVTPWDKQQINKIASIEATANAARNNFPTYGESNMNNALRTGFYPWCTLGRPGGSTGAYTLLTIASTTQDNAGYTTIEQTAYGRQNDELGKVFKRIIFKKGSEIQFGNWLEITNAIAVKKLVIKAETQADDNSVFTFGISKIIADQMIDIQGIVPCKIVAKQDGSTLNTAHFPLNSLTYRIERYVGTDTSNLKITIKIDRDVIYDNRSCTAVITSFPTIIISYI